ncbi:MAG: metallophosphoesterase [Archangium sp.]
MTFRRHVAMGDPQAPFDTVLAVLKRHRLLDGHDRLRDDVQLVSMGDHFDWGTPEQRSRATHDAVALLTWLSSHSREQVVLITGNHDLARIYELGPFSTDADFERAHDEAVQVYRHGDDEAAFVARYPHVHDAESLARDFSCFSVEQKTLVQRLLAEKRLVLAHEHRGLLLVHAGVTVDDFSRIEANPSTALEAAHALNAADVARLHQPGSSTGIARGVLFQRPAFPVDDPQFEGPLRRRYDPRRLPSAFPQAIGHIRDKKCHELLGRWVRDSSPLDGAIRSMRIVGEEVEYARGTYDDARLYFLDGGMNHIAPEKYELFDLDARSALH